MRANFSVKPVWQAGPTRGVPFSVKASDKNQKFPNMPYRILISRGQNSFLNDKLSFNDNLGKVDCTVVRKIYTSLKKLKIFTLHKNANARIGFSSPTINERENSTVDYFLNQYKLNKQKRRNPREVQLSLMYRALHVNVVQSKPHLHKFENC